MRAREESERSRDKTKEVRKENKRRNEGSQDLLYKVDRKI